jgi:hypothetical protein
MHVSRSEKSMKRDGWMKEAGWKRRCLRMFQRMCCNLVIVIRVYDKSNSFNTYLSHNTQNCFRTIHA